MTEPWWRALPEAYRLDVRDLARWVELSGGTSRVTDVKPESFRFTVEPEDLLYRAGEVWKRMGHGWKPSTPFEFTTS